MATDTTAAELIQRATAYDRCWMEGRPSDMREFLHPHVVFTGPQFRRLGVGIDACVQSYVNFLAAARIHDCKPSDYVVDIAGTTAVMTYRWTIDYQLGETRSVESGHDVLVWVREADRWLILWRNQQPDPPSEA